MTAGEGPADGTGDRELEVVEGTQPAVEVAAPVRDDRGDRDVVGDAEEQVDVGPAVLAAVRRGAGYRSSGDPGVLLGELKQLRSQRIPLVTGEHGAESSWPRRRDAGGSRPRHRRQRWS
jgi:hypothetical protein